MRQFMIHSDIYSYQSMKSLVMKLGLSSLAYCTGLLYEWTHRASKANKQFKPVLALLGDVGGTNIRLQLVLIQPPHNQPIEVIKRVTFPVSEFDSLQSAIQRFLNGVPSHPDVAVIAIAGPITDNTIAMANVPKWGTMSGERIGNFLKINQFIFINDFQACSYGILLLEPDQFESINGVSLIEHKTKGVIGPGTGLGNSILFSAPFQTNQRMYVLPSEGGHIDTYIIDPEINEFVDYLKDNTDFKYISLERSFCGPAIPLMRQFILQKHRGQSADPQTSEQILANCNSQHPDPINKRVFDLFMRIYSTTIGNFVVQHMCTGGVYLAGSLTNCILPLIRGKNILGEWLLRHPQMARTVEGVPIVVCKQIDLGLKGSYYVARRIISDQQHS